MSLLDGIINLLNPGNFDVVETVESPNSDDQTERPIGRGSRGYAQATEWAEENNRVAQSSPCCEKYKGKSYSVRPSDRDRDRDR